MKIALALEENRISSTLGGTAEFLLLDGSGTERIVCAERIPAFLQKHRVGILICGGIGNCMLDLLDSMNIRVIPGVVGNQEDVIRQFRTGTLHPGKKYSCAEHGRTCGECPGSF